MIPPDEEQRRIAAVLAVVDDLVEVSDGNLGAHLETLAKAGYVELEKQFAGKKPQTNVLKPKLLLVGAVIFLATTLVRSSMTTVRSKSFWL